MAGAAGALFASSLPARADDAANGAQTPKPPRALLGAMQDAFVAVADELRSEGPELGLRRVLAAVVDGVELQERDGLQWVELRKAVETRDA